MVQLVWCERKNRVQLRMKTVSEMVGRVVTAVIASSVDGI